MTNERVMELLNKIIDYVCIASSSHEAIKELLNMGFLSDELIEDFGWSLTDVREVENELDNEMED